MFELSQIVSDSQTYKPNAVRALKAFKAVKTWKPEVSPIERLTAMQALINSLKDEYDMHVHIPVVEGFAEYPATDENEIQIIPIYQRAGRLSVITLLNRFAAIRGEVQEDFESGRSYVGRQRWAVNLFRKVYPRQFARLIFNRRDGGFYTSIPGIDVTELGQATEAQAEAAQEEFRAGATWAAPIICAPDVPEVVEETAENNVRLSMSFGTSDEEEYTEESFEEESWER